MKTNKEIIYRCDHCNKPMFGKGAMVRHEKFCKENPNNQHKCFEFCKHLEMTVTNDGYNDYAYPVKCTEMTCTKRNVEMYSYKFEKNCAKPKNALEGLEIMPLECNDYEPMEGYII